MRPRLATVLTLPHRLLTTVAFWALYPFIHLMEKLDDWADLSDD